MFPPEHAIRRQLVVLLVRNRSPQLVVFFPPNHAGVQILKPVGRLPLPLKQRLVICDIDQHEHI